MVCSLLLYHDAVALGPSQSNFATHLCTLICSDAWPRPLLGKRGVEGPVGSRRQRSWGKRLVRLVRLVGRSHWVDRATNWSTSFLSRCSPAVSLALALCGGSGVMQRIWSWSAWERDPDVSIRLRMMFIGSGCRLFHAGASSGELKVGDPGLSIFVWCPDNLGRMKRGRTFR